AEAAMAERRADDADVRRLRFLRLRIGTRTLFSTDRSANGEAAGRGVADAPVAREVVRARGEQPPGQASGSSPQAIRRVIAAMVNHEAHESREGHEDDS